MALIYFDSNICVGKHGLKHLREIWKSEDILAAMSRAGISGGLVYAGWARDYAPSYGNEKLLEELKKSKRFYGCYVVQPGYTGSFLSPEEMIADIREKGYTLAINNYIEKKEQETVPPEEVRRQYFEAYEEMLAAEEYMRTLLVEGGYVSE